MKIHSRNPRLKIEVIDLSSKKLIPTINKRDCKWGVTKGI